jgi:peptidylprolyl isomerase/peptidyl-prolyl cis-trans isomerase B (cyclophilin B)
MKRGLYFTLATVLGLMLVSCTPADADATPSPTLGEDQVSSPIEGVTLLSTAVAGFDQPEPDYPQWDAPPEMTIDPQTTYTATFLTERGEILVELFADLAPITVNNFIFLAREGYYDETTFFRVLPDFMAQGGDPSNTGAGSPGYTFEDEFTPELLFDGPGYLAMANRGPATNGAQFFLTVAATDWLNGRHTIFGKVVEGMDVLTSLTPRDPQENPAFEGDLLHSIDIDEVEESLLPTPTATPDPIVPVAQEGRPLAELPVAERENLFTGSPAMVIDPDLSYSARIETTKGEILIELRPQDVPDLVNNFVVLADLGYWDAFPIAYVESEIFVLTGSPAGDPSSDIGYTLRVQGELSNTEGAVGYWFRQDRIAPSGSQFYILMADLSQVLDANPTVFGYVVEGLDVVWELTGADEITRITIEIGE